MGFFDDAWSTLWAFGQAAVKPAPQYAGAFASDPEGTAKRTWAETQAAFNPPATKFEPTTGFGPPPVDYEDLIGGGMGGGVLPGLRSNIRDLGFASPGSTPYGVAWRYGGPSENLLNQLEGLRMQRISQQPVGGFGRFGTY